MNRKYRRFIQSLGPGIITAALILGPGTLTVTSKLGSKYQYQHLWVLVVSTFFMVVFTLMSAKFGFYGKGTLIDAVRKKLGRIMSLVIGFGIFIVSISFQSGNSIGAGLAMGSIFKMNSEPWILFFSFVAISMLFFKSFYQILEKIMIVLVSIMLISFLITVIISQPELSMIAKGFIPRIPAGSEILTIAIFATSCSVAGAFYQSYLVQEKMKKSIDQRESQNKFRSIKIESIAGIVVLGIISSLVLIAAGSVLHMRGIEVNNVADMGKALEPLFGSISFILFMIGLFAASFSSLIGNATLGGNVLADTLNIGKFHSQRSTRILIMLLIAIGSSLAIAYSDLRLKLIVFAQAFTILVVPIIAFAILTISSSSSMMESNRNSKIMMLFGIAGLLLLITLAAAYSEFVFFKD